MQWRTRTIRPAEHLRARITIIRPGNPHNPPGAGRSSGCGTPACLCGNRVPAASRGQPHRVGLLGPMSRFCNPGDVRSRERDSNRSLCRGWRFPPPWNGSACRFSLPGMSRLSCVCRASSGGWDANSGVMATCAEGGAASDRIALSQGEQTNNEGDSFSSESICGGHFKDDADAVCGARGDRRSDRPAGCKLGKGYIHSQSGGFSVDARARGQTG